MTQSLRAFQSTFGYSDASAFSVHSAVKLEDIVNSLENPTVPARSLVTEKEAQLLNYLKQGY
ncbi:MAG: hypothetical protein C5S38_09720 [Candidatus Methanophagaceae archaeon]|nr:MAG: hypothetical protein C5S38_09720 [Methanophagales archaeon]